MDGGSTCRKVSLLVLVTSAAAVRIDASKAPTGSWDRAAFLSGFQNAPEIPAHQVRCAELPSDLVGTYYRNGASWIASPTQRSILPASITVLSLRRLSLRCLHAAPHTEPHSFAPCG